MPSRLLSQYSFLKGGSVAFFCVTRYCISVNFSFASLSSDLSIKLPLRSHVSLLTSQLGSWFQHHGFKQYVLVDSLFFYLDVFDVIITSLMCSSVFPEKRHAPTPCGTACNVQDFSCDSRGGNLPPGKKLTPAEQQLQRAC